MLLIFKNSTQWIILRAKLSVIEDAVYAERFQSVCFFCVCVFLWPQCRLRHDSQDLCLTAWEGGIREHSVRGQTRILSLEPAVSHEPSHRKRDHVRLGDAHSERITSLLSLGSPSLQLTLRTKQYVKHHIFYTCICRVNGSREPKK